MFSRSEELEEEMCRVFELVGGMWLIVGRGGGVSRRGGARRVRKRKGTSNSSNAEDQANTMIVVH